MCVEVVNVLFTCSMYAHVSIRGKKNFLLPSRECIWSVYKKKKKILIRLYSFTYYIVNELKMCVRILGQHKRLIWRQYWREIIVFPTLTWNPHGRQDNRRDNSFHTAFGDRSENLVKTQVVYEVRIMAGNGVLGICTDPFALCRSTIYNLGGDGRNGWNGKPRKR